MADQKTKQAFIISSFKDTNFDHSGIERQFTGGKIESLPEGVFDNYEHAGLVRAPTADDKAATSTDAKATKPAA